MNSGLTSADSGNPVGSGGSRYTVSQRRSGPRGLFSRAEDKVKLSDDVIEDACSRSATIVERYYFQLAIVWAFCRVGIVDSSSTKQSIFKCNHAGSARKSFVSGQKKGSAPLCTERSRELRSQTLCRRPTNWQASSLCKRRASQRNSGPTDF